MEQIQSLPEGLQSWVNTFLNGAMVFDSVQKLKDEREDLEVSLLNYQMQGLQESINQAYFNYKQLLLES